MSIHIEFGAKKPQDLAKIDHKNMSELMWWSYHLGISPEKLLSLVHKYGNNAAEMEKRVWPDDN